MHATRGSPSIDASATEPDWRCLAPYWWQSQDHNGNSSSSESLHCRLYRDCTYEYMLSLRGLWLDVGVHITSAVWDAVTVLVRVDD